jgi:predicted  nucleic acid-binding Zn-ribbon protein
MLRETIVQLREIDRRLQAVADRRASGGSRLRAQERLTESSARLNQARAGLARLETESRSQELDSKTIDARFKALQTRIYSGNESATLLFGLEAELQKLTAQRDESDEILLQTLEQRDQWLQALPALEAKAQEHEQDLASARSDDQEQDQGLEERRKQLEEQRAALCASIDPQVLDDYQRLLESTGEPTAEIRRAACTGCRMGLSDVVFRTFRVKELVCCPNCGRFLVSFQS